MFSTSYKLNFALANVQPITTARRQDHAFVELSRPEDRLTKAPPPGVATRTRTRRLSSSDSSQNRKKTCYSLERIAHIHRPVVSTVYHRVVSYRVTSAFKFTRIYEINQAHLAEDGFSICSTRRACYIRSEFELRVIDVCV
jgi:hypothetical protein